MIGGVQALQEAGVIVTIIRGVRPSNVEETNLSCLHRLLRELGEACSCGWGSSLGRPKWMRRLRLSTPEYRKLVDE